MAGTSYAQKLTDPRWQKKRLEIFNRDSWECQVCTEAGKTLAVHHKKYVPGRNPWDYDDNLLTTLCEPCHKLLSKPTDETQAPEWHDGIILRPLYEDEALHCPNCDCDCLHHNALLWFLRKGEDGEGGAYELLTSPDVVIDSKMEGNPSSRRDGLKIQFWCEGCDKISVLCIVQHKGQTFIGWSE